MDGRSKRRKIKIGQIYNRLTVVKSYTYIANGRHWMHECICICGNLTVVRTSNLLREEIKSCGCLFSEQVSKAIINRCTTHGNARRKNYTTEYKSYAAIKTRCYNLKSKDYRWYGAKGIKMCDRWLNSFENFLEDMGPKPVKGWHIDRIDSTKDYEPSNCQWLSPADNLNKMNREQQIKRILLNGSLT